MTRDQPGKATPKAGSGAAHRRPTGPSDMWAVKGRDGSIATGWIMMPLRLFLGITFFFAGLQKLANPDFLKSASPISIHAQLLGATHSSPIHALITHLVPIAPVVGVVIAVGEVAIGLGVLVGLWTRVAAVAGMALSFGLFLTVSFHSSPYFTGSDIVFVFAWTPLALGGTAGGPSLDTWLARTRPAVTATSGKVTRRAVLSKGAFTGVTAAAVLIAGGVAAALGRAVGGTTTAAGGSATLSGGSGSTTPPSTAAPATTVAGGSTPSTTDAPPSTTQAIPSGQEVGAATQVPVGGSAVFTVPSSGDPGLIIQQQAGEFVAFDAICPHAGCTVAYQMSSQIIACPCHGSEFNPKTGDVVRGPATHGLTRVKVAKGSNGNLYVAD